MRLSQAIRLGSLLRPQAFGRHYNGRTNSTCAQGAAMEAIGIDVDIMHDPQQWWPRIQTSEHFKEWKETFARREFLCPACGLRERNEAGASGNPTWDVSAIMIHLNNSHRWTRERIADWVEAQENQVSVQARDERPEPTRKDAPTLAAIGA